MKCRHLLLKEWKKEEREEKDTENQENKGMHAILNVEHTQTKEKYQRLKRIIGWIVGIN